MAEKRKVTMTSVTAGENGVVLTHQAEDYVKLEHLDAYVADAKTRWQNVTVGDEPDNGPGGDDDDYTVHAHMKGE